ncbi:unnamed protein product [Pylaiella littoralis]
MPQPRSRQMNPTPSSSAAAPVCLVAGILLGSRCSSVQALVPSAAATAPSFRGFSLVKAPSTSSVSRGRANVRPRQTSKSSLFATAAEGGGAGDMDSSELYRDLRCRLEELRHSSTSDNSDGLTSQEDVSDLGLVQQQEDIVGCGKGNCGGGGAAAVKVYSSQEMKQRYYEAFWRARNLHKESKFVGSSSGVQADDGSNTNSGGESSENVPPIAPSPEATAEVASRTTILTPMAMRMFRSLDSDPAAEPSGANDDVQGLTQMYYLEEEAEQGAAAAAVASSTAAVGVAPVAAYATASSHGSYSSEGAAGATVGVDASFSSDESSAAAADAVEMFAEPQGLTQVYFLDPEMEAEAAAALPVVPGRSFLRERLGVSGEVVQGLRQVELDHARLAMLAVLLSGVIGAGAGAGVDAALTTTHEGFAALAEVARTPWLDPYVAGGILAAKALSEGDWRIGKGAMAGWADKALSSVSNTGAKVLRFGSGNEIRRLAVEMEVKHGRLALGAVVCAMAQQGILTTVAV